MSIKGTLNEKLDLRLEKHMDNVRCKWNALIIAINSARKDGYNLTIEFNKLKKDE